MKIHKFACYFTSERPRVALYIMCLCMATKETWGSEWEVFRGKWKIRKKEVQKLWSLHRKKCTLLIFTRHDVIFAMIYSFMWVNRVACISRQKCETLIARKYPFNETSEMIYVVDDVLLDVVCVCVLVMAVWYEKWFFCTFLPSSMQHFISHLVSFDREWWSTEGVISENKLEAFKNELSCS